MASKQRSEFIECALYDFIDYAGIFPPASLSFKESFKNFSDFMQASGPQIVGNIAWHAKDLAELTTVSGGHPAFGVAVIGRPASRWDDWQNAREADTEDMNRFLERSPNAEIATYEFKIPAVNLLEDVTRSSKPFATETNVCFEIPWVEGMEEMISGIAESEFGYAKFRFGGTDAEAYPSIELAARAIKQCVDLDLPFKCTAGLHQPIAHTENAYGVHAHGFLNILTAVAGGLFADLNLGEIEKVLAATDPGLWRIGAGLAFEDLTFDGDQLAECRAIFDSIGSCSVEEPLEGLDQLESL
jgi:hypothetical protein